MTRRGGEGRKHGQLPNGRAIEDGSMEREEFEERGKWMATHLLKSNPDYSLPFVLNQFGHIASCQQLELILLLVCPHLLPRSKSHVNMRSTIQYTIQAMTHFREG